MTLRTARSNPTYVSGGRLDEALPSGDNTLGRVKIAGNGLSVVGGSVSSSGDNQIIASPGAGWRICVYVLLCWNNTANSTNMIWRDGTTTVIPIPGKAEGDGALQNFPDGYPWKLSENSALNLNLSGANECYYFVGYYTEAI